jgi:hypothetical protein
MVFGFMIKENNKANLGNFSQASRHCRPEVRGSISRVIKYAYLQKLKISVKNLLKTVDS